MLKIRLSAEEWRSPADFFSALLPELGAPEWHGRNLDALFDSLSGGINELEPPFAVEVVCTSRLSPEMSSFMAKAVKVFDDARADFGHDVCLQLA